MDVTGTLTFSRRGFTLVEVLVVVTIVGILASVLFPVGQNAVARAKGSACFSNVRQLGIASKLYADDNAGLLPPFTNNLDFLQSRDPSYNPTHPENDHEPFELKAALSPYVKDSNVWFCPLDVNARASVTRGSIDHRLTSYVFAHSTPGDASIAWPVSVKADASDMQARPLLWDAYELPFPAAIGPFSNHPDDTVNMVWGDLSAHATTIAAMFPNRS